MPIHRLRHGAAILCAAALLAACSSPVRIPGAASVAEADRPARTPVQPVADLSPAQALTPQAQGLRVRWSGGINAIDAHDGGQQCFTLLHATFDARQALQWPREPQNFVACGQGRYDQQLVTQFTLLTLDGRVTGQQLLLGRPVPVIEIDALYRHSDCVQGSEKSPECYSGFLQPKKP
ncbi:MAG: hypothetical protein V4636_07435 [Pseudomonadota bacterium]